MDLGNRIPENIINELRDKCDIVEYISRYVTLKKKGSNYMGLCPFHKEKTPSFVVSRDKKIFHCFGCGEGGSLFNFLSKIEAKSFYQVVKELAREKGITIDTDSEPEEVTDRRNRLFSVCFEAMKYYNEALYSAEGEKCLTYLRDRGITENLIIEHNLGYSPQNSELLYNKLLKLGFTQEDILDSGIFSKSQGKIQDRFSKRLIIPLIDQDKRTVGFAGRNLDNRKDTAKYINSPESQIYHKSSYLYGLNIASRHSQKSRYIIVVEGYFDLISLNNINFFNVIATCGTALTQSHIRLLRRFTKDICLCFDSDSAGRAAVYKAARTLLTSGLGIYVISLPSGDDPDSFARKNGNKAFSDLVKNRVPFINYLADDVRKAIGKRPHMRAALIKKMLSYIQLMPDILEQREAIRTVSAQTGIEEDVIYSYLRNSARTSGLSTPAPQRIKHKSYEVWLVAILTQFPHLTENLPEDLPDIIESPDISAVYREILSVYKKDKTSPPVINDNTVYSEITEVIMNKTFPDNESDAFSILLDCLHRLQIDRLKKEIREIDMNISSAKKSGDEKLIDSLIKKKLELSKSIQLREIKYG